jgi:hypothetical protein
LTALWWPVYFVGNGVLESITNAGSAPLVLTMPNSDCVFCPIITVADVALNFALGSFELDFFMILSSSMCGVEQSSIIGITMGFT